MAGHATLPDNLGLARPRTDASSHDFGTPLPPPPVPAESPTPPLPPPLASYIHAHGRRRCRRPTSYSPTMARRIVRTCIQISVLSFVLAGVLFFLDSRYRVLPTQIHSLLPEHHAGAVVIDVAYKQCAVLVSSCTLDANAGWVRVQKDVFLRKGWLQKGFLHYKVRGESELLPGEKVLVDVRVSKRQPETEDGQEPWERRSGGIWIRRQTKVVDNAVTAVDVLFGADAAEVREGWKLLGGTLGMGMNARLTVRRGAPIESKKPVVRMRKDHRLKIIQVSGAPVYLSVFPILS